MHQPLVSIIVPCYKQAEYLPETLDSVLAQTYPNWECVIVNDGSPDNTDEIGRLYVEKDARFVYVCQENAGPSVARNSGIKNSHGEFILPLDADDLISPVYIEKAVGHFSEFPNTKLVYCKAERYGKENAIWDLPSYDYERFIWDNCIFCSAIYRRIDYDKTSGYNANMVYGNEDWDFWLSLLKKGDTVFRIDEVLFYYRIKDVSRTTNLVSHHWQESLVQLCHNHPEIYDSYKEKLILYFSKYYKEEQEIQALRDELDRIRHTHAYRLGKFLLKPFTWIRNKR